MISNFIHWSIDMLLVDLYFKVWLKDSIFAYRSLLANEKHKKHAARKQRTEIHKVHERMTKAIRSITNQDSIENVVGPEEGLGSTPIHGFRYRSNGDERKNTDDLKRHRFMSYAREGSGILSKQSSISG